MKKTVLVVWPKMPSMLYTFDYLRAITGRAAGFMPLPAAAGAAYIPDHYDVRIIDENVEGCDWLNETLTSVVLVVISFMNSQYARAIEITMRIQAQGIPVAWAGAMVTYEPTSRKGPADYVLIGPAEGMAEQFFRDFESGVVRHQYEGAFMSRFAGEHKPPRFDLLKIPSYQNALLQTSEGCPYRCTFCREGHRVLFKPLKWVLKEMSTLHELGVRSVVFSDANLWNKRQRFRELMQVLAAWNGGHDWSMRFGGEVSLNLADEPELLQLMTKAGFQVAYVGIETLSVDGLLNIEKKQNISRRGLTQLQMIREFQRAGMEVMSGLIAGFDHDTKDCFREIVDFVEEAGITFTTAGSLVAMPGTKIWDKLRKERRLIEEGAVGSGQDSANFGGLPNFEPNQMEREDLKNGARWMWDRLATVKSFRRRLKSLVRHLGSGNTPLNWRIILDRNSREIFWRIWKAYYCDPKLRPAFYAALRSLILHPTKIGVITRAMCLFWQLRKSAEETGTDLDNVPEAPFAN